MRTLDSIVRRVLACRPETDDPAECGLGNGPAVTDAYRTCKTLFWSGLEDVRIDSDERTLPEVMDAVRGYLRSEGAAYARLNEGFAELVGQDGTAVKVLGYADLRMPDRPEETERNVLDRTLQRGWRRRLWTVALLYRSLLWKRRGIQEQLRERKTALAIAGLRDRLPPDVLVTVVRMVRLG